MEFFTPGEWAIIAVPSLVFAIALGTLPAKKSIIVGGVLLGAVLVFRVIF